MLTAHRCIGDFEGLWFKTMTFLVLVIFICSLQAIGEFLWVLLFMQILRSIEIDSRSWVCQKTDTAIHVILVHFHCYKLKNYHSYIVILWYWGSNFAAFICMRTVHSYAQRTRSFRDKNANESLCNFHTQASKRYLKTTNYKQQIFKVI